MENVYPNDPTLALVSFLVNRELNDPNEPPEEKNVKIEPISKPQANSVPDKQDLQQQGQH